MPQTVKCVGLHGIAHIASHLPPSSQPIVLTPKVHSADWPRDFRWEQSCILVLERTMVAPWESEVLVVTGYYVVPDILTPHIYLSLVCL